MPKVCQKGLGRLHLDCVDCIWIMSIVFGLYDCIWIVQLYLDYVNCIWIVRLYLDSTIVFGLCQLYLDCVDCIWIVQLPDLVQCGVVLPIHPPPL